LKKYKVTLWNRVILVVSNRKLQGCGSGSTLKEEAGSRSKLGSSFHKIWGRDVEAEDGNGGSG